MEQLYLLDPLPTIHVAIVTEARHDPQSEEEIQQPNHKRTTAKPLSNEMVLQRQRTARQQGAEEHKAQRIVHAEVIGAPARHVARFRSHPATKRRQREYPDEVRLKQDAEGCIDQKGEQQEERIVPTTCIECDTELRNGPCRGQYCQEENGLIALDLIWGLLAPDDTPPVQPRGNDRKGHALENGRSFEQGFEQLLERLIGQRCAHRRDNREEGDPERVLRQLS